MVSDYTAHMDYMDPAVPRKAVKFNPSLSHSLTCMVSADSLVSVIDQVIQFTALFVVWFPYFSI